MGLSKHIPAILDRLSQGESLNAICKTEGFPAESTVRLWAKDDVDGFAAKYARAREIGYERLADEILEIADDGTNDTRTDDEGNVMTDYDVIQRSKLRVDARKWILSKMLPKVFGDKVDVTSGGKELKAPIVGLQVVERAP